MSSSLRRVISSLQSCGLSRDLQRGKRIHAQVTQGEPLTFNIYVANSLLNMYATCGSLEDAHQVFERMPCHSIVSWNSLMLGYVEARQEDEALKLFSRIRHPPSSLTYVAVFKACTALAGKEDPIQVSGGMTAVRRKSLETGMSLHSRAAAAGLDSDVFVATTLISMYSKCVSLLDARLVFDTMHSRNVVAWNALLLGYAENGEETLSLELFTYMKTSPTCQPNASTFVAALKACGNLGEARLEKAVELHGEASRAGVESDVFVACSLVSLYSRCGSMELAKKVFDRMANRSVVAWNGLITGYAENREERLALGAYSLLQSSKVCAPNALTFVAALKACMSLADVKVDKVELLERAMDIHSQSVNFGYENDLFVGSTLVSLYSKCGSMVDARKVFDKMKSRNTVSWNALLLGYAENEQPEVALELFERMQTRQERDCSPDARSFVAALKACSLLAGKEPGRLVEGKLLKVKTLETGRRLHSEASARGVDAEMFVSSSLVDMYAKCGEMTEARKAFEGMTRRDVVTWTSLILGYAENSQGELALETFHCMQEEGVSPDARTFIALLKACTGSVKLEAGKRIHAEIYKSGDEQDTVLSHCLVEFYAKCGSMVNAQVVFERLSSSNDVMTWTALLAGYSRQGDSGHVFRLFNEMEDQGLRPDGVTLLCVLTACSHNGMVERGRRVFEDMQGGKYGAEVETGLEHYHCMADLLGRGNRLHEAVELVKGMPFTPNRMTWSIILGACHKWKNVELGKVAYEQLLKLGDVEDSSGSAVYSLMRNIYGGSCPNYEYFHCKEPEGIHER